MNPVRLDVIAKHLERDSIYGSGKAPEGPITLTEEELRAFADFPTPHKEHLARQARRQPSAVFQQVLDQVMRELAKVNADAIETLETRWPEGYEYLRLVAALPMLGLPVSPRTNDGTFQLYHDPDTDPIDYLMRWELADITVLREFFIRHDYPLPAFLIDTKTRGTPTTPDSTCSRITPVDAYAQRNGLTLDEVFHAALDGRLTVALRADGELFYAWKRDRDGRPAMLALCEVTGLLTLPPKAFAGSYKKLLLGTAPEAHRIAALVPLPEYPPAITVINDEAYGEPYLSLEGLEPPFYDLPKMAYYWPSGEAGFPVADALSVIRQGVNSFMPATPLAIQRDQFVVVEAEHWTAQSAESGHHLDSPYHPQAAVELGRLLAMLRAAEPERDPTQTLIDLLALDEPNAPALELLPAHPKTGDHESRPPISRREVKTALERLKVLGHGDDITVTANPGQKTERPIPVTALWIRRNDWRDGYAAQGYLFYPWPSSEEATFCWYPVVEEGKSYHAYGVDQLTGTLRTAEDFQPARQAKLWSQQEAVSWLLATDPDRTADIGERFDLAASPSAIKDEEARHLPDFVLRFRRLREDIDDAIELGELAPTPESRKLKPADVVRWAKENDKRVPEALADAWKGAEAQRTDCAAEPDQAGADAGGQAVTAEEGESTSAGWQYKDDQRIAIIVKVAKEQFGHDPLNIPFGGKTEIKSYCTEHYPENFPPGKTVFDKAWEKASRTNQIRHKYRDQYAKRIQHSEKSPKKSPKKSPIIGEFAGDSCP